MTIQIDDSECGPTWITIVIEIIYSVNRNDSRGIYLSKIRSQSIFFLFCLKDFVLLQIIYIEKLWLVLDSLKLYVLNW